MKINLKEKDKSEKGKGLALNKKKLGKTLTKAKEEDVINNLDALLAEVPEEEVVVTKKKKSLNLFKKPKIKDPLVAADVDYTEELVVLTAEEKEAEIHSYFDSGLSLDAIEEAEYKKAKKELRLAEARKQAQDRQDFIDSFRKPNTIFGFLGITLGAFTYLYFCAGQLIFSFLVAAYIGVQMTYWFIYKENQLKIYQHDLHELQGVASDIEFEAQTGKNALQILDKIRPKYKGRVGADLDYTYTKLLSETILDTTYFYDYDFKAFDLFMRNFNIWYKEGGNTRALFTKSIDNISFELIQRDKLFKMNKGKRSTEMLVVMISLMTPIMIKLFGGDSYNQFMGYPLAVAVINVLFMLMVVKTVVGIQKKVLDIKIRG